MVRCAIIIGHDQSSQGAVSYNGISEWIFNNGVATMLEELSSDHKDIEIRVFCKQGLNYSAICAAYETWKPDLSIELHFNSYKKVARGMECLVLEECSDSWEVADLLTDYMSELMDISERRIAKKMDGVLLCGHGVRGRTCLDEVANYAHHALLYEPCFGNTRNPDSIKLFADHGEFYSTALYKAIRMVLDLPHYTEGQKDDMREKIKFLQDKIDRIKAIL